LREIDGATGYYARLEWRPVSKLTLDLFGYDNKGDRISVEDREWSWETRFFNLGARLDLGDTQTKAQVMHGETLMGYSNVNGVWIDAGFEAAYVSVTRALGPGADRTARSFLGTRPHQQGGGQQFRTRLVWPWPPIAGM
jgi:hypothetical protein